MSCRRCNLKRIMEKFKKQDEARKRAAEVSQEKPEVEKAPVKNEAPVEIVPEIIEALVVEEKAEVAPVEETAATPAPRRRRTRKTVEEAPTEIVSEEVVAQPEAVPEEETTPTEVENVTEDAAE